MESGLADILEMFFEQNHAMSKEIPLNRAAGIAVPNVRSNMGESAVRSGSLCPTDYSFHADIAPLPSSTHHDSSSSSASATVMWNYNPYRRRQSQDAAIYCNKYIPAREAMDSDVLSVSITNCSNSDNHNMSRPQGAAEDDFRRQVRKLSIY